MIANAASESSPVVRRWSRWKTAGLIFLVWTAIAVAGGLQSHQNFLFQRPGVPGDPALNYILWTMRPAYTWALLTPLIWRLVRRFPPSQPWTFALAQLAGMLGSILLQVLCRAGFGLLFESEETIFSRAVWDGLKIGYFTTATTYAMIVGVLLSLESFRRLTAERELSARARADAIEARLDAVQAQLQPHFLFNTLHAISTLVTESPPRAVEMIARLGELLRDSLQRAGKAEARLQEELDFAEGYLAIEQVRLGARLRVEWDIAPAARDLLVPRFLLQPLVENAIRHGVARSSAPGWVRIAVALEPAGGRLHVEVANSLPREAAAGGFSAAQGSAGLGVSLANLRERLEVLYGAGNSSFSLDRPADAGGARAVVLLPARPAEEPDAEMPARLPAEARRPAPHPPAAAAIGPC